MKVKITYPVTTFASRELEISDEEYENLMSFGSRVDFIYTNVEPDDEDWVDQKTIEQAFDVGYASIKKIL